MQKTYLLSLALVEKLTISAPISPTVVLAVLRGDEIFLVLFLKILQVFYSLLLQPLKRLVDSSSP